MDTCTRQALLLVCLQIGLLILVAHLNWTVPANLWLLSALLLFVSLFVIPYAPRLAWCLFTLALLGTMTPAYQQMPAGTAHSAACTTVLLLLFASLFVNEELPWSALNPWLQGALLFLIVVLFWNICSPLDARLLSAVSVLGAAVFTLFIMRDLSQKVCDSPWERSIVLTLDLVNLFNFTSMQ